MAIEVYERLADSGTYTKLGDASPNGAGSGDAPAPAGTDAPAAPGHGEASSAPNGETSAPPSETPDGTPPRVVASDGTPPGDEDDDDVADDVATIPFVNRRIRQLNAKRRVLERTVAEREAAWTQERAHLQGQIETMTRIMNGAAPALPETPQPSGPPQAEAYTSHEDYVRAVARYEAQQVQQTQHQQMQAQQAAQALQAREAAFTEAHPGWQTVVQQGLVARPGYLGSPLQQVLMHHPEGVAMAYTLAAQPETVHRLLQMPPPMMLMELGRLAPPSPPPGGTVPLATPTTGTPPASPPPLPPPLAGVNGQGTVPTPGFSETMSAEDYRNYRRRTSNLPVWKHR
jgi:hypothetical protein